MRGWKWPRDRVTVATAAHSLGSKWFMGQKTETGVTSHIAIPPRASSTADFPDQDRVASKEVSAEPRLLLVDDRPELLKSMSEIVTLHGYRVTEALGGQAA